MAAGQLNGSHMLVETGSNALAAILNPLRFAALAPRVADRNDANGLVFSYFILTH